MKYKKVIPVFCTVLLSTFVLTRMMSDDVKVVNLLKPHYESKDVEVVEGDNYFKYMSDLNDIKKVKWVNENVVEFKGSKKNEDKASILQLDCNSKKLLKNNNETEKFYIKDFKDNIQYVNEIDKDNYLIYVDGDDKKGLFHVRNGKEPILIANDIKLKDELLFKISDNKEKVAYYDVGDKIIKVYNFINNKAVNIAEDSTIGIVENFKNNIDFSHEAGYLCVSNINKEDFKESYFSVYGADSGKVYKEKLLGINPVWGMDNLTIAFTYLEDNSITNTKNVISENLVGDRVGFYNLRTRKIKYTQSMGKGYKVIKPALWNKNNEILIVVGKYLKADNRYLFNKIYSYDLKNNILGDLQGYLKDIDNIGADFETVLVDNHIYIYSCNKQDENAIGVVDLEKRSGKEIESVQDFISKGVDNDTTMFYKALDSNSFLYVQNNSIYVSDLKSSHLKFRANGKITNVYESPDKSKIFIISEAEKGVELAIVDL